MYQIVDRYRTITAGRIGADRIAHVRIGGYLERGIWNIGSILILLGDLQVSVFFNIQSDHNLAWIIISCNYGCSIIRSFFPY